METVDGLSGGKGPGGRRVEREKSTVETGASVEWIGERGEAREQREAGRGGGEEGEGRRAREE